MVSKEELDAVLGKKPNGQEKVVPPWYIERDAISSLIDSDERVDLLEMMDNETNIVYKMLKFLHTQDNVKESITKYQMAMLNKESSLSLIRDYKKDLISNIKWLIRIIESMRIDDFDEYVNAFEKFESNEDVLELNSNLQRLHTEIVGVLQNYGIREKIETDKHGMDTSNILIYEVGSVTLLMKYEELPQYIKDFITNFNELAVVKGSKCVIFYDKIGKTYRIDIYLGAASGHRAIIKAFEESDTFELVYTDACYSRLMAVKMMLENYHKGEFGMEVKDLQPDLGNVTWKQAVLYFKSPNMFLSEMADLIKIINWDYIVNVNNKEKIATVENEAETIYDGAFGMDVKCHASIVKLMTGYLGRLRNY